MVWPPPGASRAPRPGLRPTLHCCSPSLSAYIPGGQISHWLHGGRAAGTWPAGRAAGTRPAHTPPPPHLAAPAAQAPALPQQASRVAHVGDRISTWTSGAGQRGARGGGVAPCGSNGGYSQAAGEEGVRAVPAMPGNARCPWLHCGTHRGTPPLLLPARWMEGTAACPPTLPGLCTHHVRQGPSRPGPSPPTHTYTRRRRDAHRLHRRCSSRRWRGPRATCQERRPRTQWPPSPSGSPDRQGTCIGKHNRLGQPCGVIPNRTQAAMMASLAPNLA